MQEIDRSSWFSSAGWCELPPAPPAELERVARLTVPLDEAFLTIARYQEEHARSAADLSERERWALAALLTRSAPLWKAPAPATLRFAVGRPGEPAPYHLELGCFAHLEALIAPTADERALIAAPPPCWARVAPHPARQQAGQAGALACAYTPISADEAVAALGFRRILAQIEEATRAAGKALLAEAQAQAERQASVLAVERMLHVAPEAEEEPGGDRASLPARCMLMLIGRRGHARPLLISIYVACVVVLCVVLIGTV